MNWSLEAKEAVTVTISSHASLAGEEDVIEHRKGFQEVVYQHVQNPGPQKHLVQGVERCTEYSLKGGM